MGQYLEHLLEYFDTHGRLVRTLCNNRCVALLCKGLKKRLSGGWPK